MPRAVVRLLLDCTNRCAFCAQADAAPSGEPADVERALERARAAHDEITFVGGEPTLDPALADHVREAARLGFRRIGIQTNGSRFGDAVCAGLVRAGLTDVHLSLHGPDAAVHDYHSGRPGSFEEVVAAARAAQRHGVPVVVTTVLTRSSFRVLARLPELLRSLGVSGWFVSIPVLAGRAYVDRDRIAPRLGLAMPFALQAIAAARAIDVPSWVAGAPLCLLGPFAAGALSGPPRAHGDVCSACPARPACPGVDPTYLARFGGDELFARDAPARAEASATTAMFVGDGALAMPVAPVAAPATRTRVVLPVLGRVKPAIAEANAATERRTGDALKEILPALFDTTAK